MVGIDIIRFFILHGNSIFACVFFLFESLATGSLSESDTHWIHKLFAFTD